MKQTIRFLCLTLLAMVTGMAQAQNVAKIGNTEYATLQAAVDAAQQLGGSQTINLIGNVSGETVTIQEVANFQLSIDGQKDASSNYTVDAQIIVDGLRGNGGSNTNGASVTLQNIVFENETAKDVIKPSHYPHHLTIQNCTYTGSPTSSNNWFLNVSDGPLYGATIKNVTVESSRLIQGPLALDVVFENIVATNNCTVGFNIKTSGTVLIKDCQITTAKYAFRDYADSYEGTITLEGNTFNSTSTGSDEGVIVNRGGTVGTTHINVESGTYTGHIKVLNNKEGVLAISGGYFSEEFPQEYIAEDLNKVCVPASDMEGYYTLGDPHYVAQIGETKYVTLQAALDAAHEMTGDVTVELIDDISEYAIVHQNAGLNQKIDGADKKVSGNIVIDGDGRASGTETLTIQNIKFEGDGTNFCSGTSSFVEVPSTKDTGKDYTTGKYNYAHNITIDNCSFTSTTSGLTMAAVRATSGAGLYNITISNSTGTNLHSLAQLVGTTGGTVTNNTVNSSESFVNVNGGGGEFTISSNTFSSAEGADGYGIRENGTSTAVITLSDNNFTAASAVVMGKSSQVTAGTINVVSGTYVGEITKTDAATGKIVISGGHFSATIGDPAYAQFIAEGFCGVNGLYPDDTAAPNGIGTAIASVTNGETVINYASLEAAMAAVVDGSTLTLLQSITLSDKINCELQEGETFTLSYGSYSISPTKSIKLNPDVTVNTDKTSSVSTFYTDAEGYYVKGAKSANGTYTYTVEEADIEYTATNGTVTYMGYTTTFMSGSGTYKVLKDFTATARINPGSLASNVTLDLNGHTLTSTATDNTVLLSRNGTASSAKTFSIVDTSTEGGGKIVANTSANAAIMITGDYNDVTIGEGVTIDGNCVAIAGSGSNSADNCKLTVNGTINGGDDFAIATNGSLTKNATININEGAVLTSNVTAIYLPGTGTTTISGGTITGSNGIYVKSGELNITGGEITGNGDATEFVHNPSGTSSVGAALVVENCGYPGGEPVVSVTGGTFTSTNADAIASYSYGEGNEPIAHFVEGGYFSSELDREICEEGKKCVSATEKPGYYKLGDIEYVAQIGETKYESLADAVAAVPTDGTATTITMIANEMINVTGYAVTIPATKNIILDLNGYQVVGTVEQEGTSALIRNLGTLTIKDSSDTNKDGSGTGKLMSGASPTWTWDGSDDYSGSYASNLIRNEKNLIVESGYLYNMSTGSAAYAIDNYSAGNVTINSGKVDAAKASAIRMFYVNGGSITVNDGIIGHYNSDDDCTYMGIQVMSGTNVNVSVNGGTIVGNYAVYANNTGGNINISGGTYDGYIGFAASVPNIEITDGAFNYWVGTWGDQTKFISGGIYAEEVDEEYIADGYILADNTDPETMVAYPYTVRKANYICAIGTTKYETLAEAVTAAGTAETTITLLTDAATEGVISGDGVVVPSGSNITFDLNGLTYNVSGETVGSSGTKTSGFQLLKESNITFKNGTLKATSPTAQMLIQNYSNLTLEDVNLDGTALSGWAYALSNNCGTINLTGSTSITAKNGGRAFDTCKFGSYAIPTVNINTTGAITGPIEATGGKLNVENGKFDVTWVTDNNYTAGDIQISGGVFSTEPADEYLAEGYVVVDNTDEATMNEYPFTVKSKEDAGIFDLFDDIDYARTDNVQANKVTYTRYFSPNVTDHYQAWFIPFDYTIKEEDADNFDFYKIHLISASDKQEQDDLIEDNTKVYIHIEPIEAGTVLRANRPYVVKPKAEMTHVFEAENVTLYGIDNSIRLTMSTSEWDYNFYGTYETFKEENQTAHQWIGLNTKGNYFWNKDISTLHRYRWYIKVSANTDNGDYAKLNLVFIEDNGETTDIKNVLPEDEIEGIYTLDGVKVQAPVKGMNIIRFTNGKTKKINVK